MAKGINIGVASDTKAFSQGIKSGVIEPLDGVADVLDDMVKAGDDAGQSLTRSLEDQQRATEDLRGDYQKLNREIEDGSSRSSRSMSESTTRASHEASEGLGEVRESAQSNATEVAASFDGSAQSVVDGFQGAASEAFAGFGPAGALAGLAAAAGIGLISKAMSDGTESTEAFKQDVADLATDLIETGSRGSASIDTIVSSLQGLATGEDSAGRTLGSLQDIAKKTGISFEDLAQAYAGNSDGLSTLIGTQKKHLAALVDQRIAQNDVTGGINRAPSAISKQIGAQEDLIVVLEETKKKQKEAAKEQKAYVDSGAEALDLAGQAQSSYADAVQSSYADAGSAIEDYVTKGKFNLDEYQKATEANLKAIVEYQGNMAKAQVTLAKGGHDQAIQYLEQLGPDAAPLIAAFIKAPEKQKGELAATWDQLGSTAATSFGTKLQGDLDAQVPTQKVKLKVDDSELVNAIAGNQGFVVKGSLSADGSLYVPGGKLVR